MTHIVFFTRVTLLIVFAAALLGKLHSRAAWSAFVAATGSLLGARRAQQIWAASVVLVEACTVGCLATSKTAYAGLVLALVVLSAFGVVVVSGVVRGVRTSCNCFGSVGTPLGWAHVWRSAVLAGVAALGTAVATVSTVPSLLAGATYATPIVLSLFASALFVMWDDMTYLVGGPQDDEMITSEEGG